MVQGGAVGVQFVGGNRILFGAHGFGGGRCLFDRKILFEMSEQKFDEMAQKLIGLHIDTNERKYEPVNRVNCHGVLKWLIDTDRLPNLRRMAPNSKVFTAYTYHGGNLQETLQEYLQS